MPVMRFLVSIAVSLVAVVVALVACEVIGRRIDGYPVTTLRLPPVRKPTAPPRLALDPTLGGGALPVDVDPAWIDMEPAPLEHPPIDRRLLTLSQSAARLGLKGFELFRVWNRRMVERWGCKPGNRLQRIPPPLLVFDPAEPITYPPYRYRPSSTLPGGMVVNRFGWRGPDIPLNKPPGTVRLAFVGASTTAGMYALPFSYPEYVVHWLNLWAERAGIAARFDGINAGREGIDSSGIAAVIRQELLPAEPDLVLYYEGANQSLCVRPPPNPPPRPPPGRLAAWVDRVVTQTRDYSALARRLQGVALRLQMHGGYEPAKPALAVRWPPIDEQHPDLTDRHLPGDVKNILRDLEAARVPLEGSGGELAIGSFAWLVDDGLYLDPVRDSIIFRNLNEGCWPYRYADLRRSIDFNNRVLARYAEIHDLLFIDVAALLPRDPALFFDAVHLNADGTRLHAWVVFRALLPVVRAHLESGAWPRPDRVPQPDVGFGAGTPFTLSCPNGDHPSQ